MKESIKSETKLKKVGTRMTKLDFLLHYLTLAPMQISLIRFLEAYEMSKYDFEKPILDIGVSDGVFGQVLFWRKNAVDIGIDVDEKALKFAKKKNAYTKIESADARNLPFADQKFATVFSNQSLEHIPGVSSVITDVHKVLKPKGKFILLVPNTFLIDYWLTSAVFKSIGLNFLAKWVDDARNKLFKHYNLWNLGRWQKLLEKNGFRVDSHKYIGSKRNYFVSEFFWPARALEMIINGVTGKNVRLFKKFNLKIAKNIFNYIDRDYSDNPPKGPTVLIITTRI